MLLYSSSSQTTIYPTLH